VKPAWRGPRGASLRSCALIVAALVLVACSPASLVTPTYAGLRIGPIETCPPGPIATDHPTPGQPSLWDCDANLAIWLTAARHNFDCRDPGHAAMGRSTLHQAVVPDTPAGPSSGPVQIGAGIPYEVAVFELADGTIRAIKVGHVDFDYRSPVETIDCGPGHS
jgi:hypothetical protein